MPTHPDPEVLYPDVVAKGSLAAALRTAVVEQKLTVPVPVVESSTVYRALVATTVPHRKELEISASHVERRWSIRGCERDQELALVEGGTRDLGEIARVAQAWHDGSALADIAQVASFVKLTGRFEVPNQDPAQMVESEWQYLRTEADLWRAKFPEFGALIEAAYAEPRFRQLYPFTSHWSLRFATGTRPSLSRDVRVCVHPSPGKPYVVTMDYMGQELGRSANAEEAVSLAVSHLPADLSPVVYGAPDRAS